jgi:molecular chaperone GrpE
MSDKKPKVELDKNTIKIIDNLEKKRKNLEEKIKNLKNNLKEYEDKLLRSYADIQNKQKRAEKILKNNIKEIKKRYLLELIDINELLKNAIEDENPKKGLELIINNLEKLLEEEQIRYIDCIGKTFDHNIHHAVNTIEKNDCQDKTIVEEVKKGYLLNDDLLRPSQVVVVKRKETV